MARHGRAGRPDYAPRTAMHIHIIITRVRDLIGVLLASHIAVNDVLCEFFDYIYAANLHASAIYHARCSLERRFMKFDRAGRTHAFAWAIICCGYAMCGIPNPPPW